MAVHYNFLFGWLIRLVSRRKYRITLEIKNMTSRYGKSASEYAFVGLRVRRRINTIGAHFIHLPYPEIVRRRRRIVLIPCAYLHRIISVRLVYNYRPFIIISAFNEKPRPRVSSLLRTRQVANVAISWLFRERILAFLTISSVHFGE